MSTQPLLPDDIEGLPPGATLKSIQNLPPGAVLKAIQKQPAAPASAPPQPEGFFHSFLSQLGGLLSSPGPGSVPTPQIAAGMAENFMDAMGQANKPVSPTTGLPLADPLGAIKGLHTTAALLTPFGGQSLEKGLE